MDASWQFEFEFELTLTLTNPQSKQMKRPNLNRNSTLVAAAETETIPVHGPGVPPAPSLVYMDPAAPRAHESTPTVYFFRILYL